MLLPTALTKSWIYYILPFTVSRTFLLSGKRFLIENFTGVLIMNFTPDWESEIAQISQKIDVITQKWELFRKKQFYWRIFLQESWNPVKRRTVVIQNSVIKCYHEFQLNFLLTKVILPWFKIFYFLFFIVAFFIFHETTYNHVIKESYDFVQGDSSPWIIILSSLVVMSYVKTKI